MDVTVRNLEKKIIHVFVSRIDFEKKQLEQLNRNRHDKKETTQLLHGASINNKRSHPITKTSSKKKEIRDKNKNVYIMTQTRQPC